MVVAKAEAKPEPMAVTKAEPKPEPKLAEKVEAKAEPKAEAKAEHRYAVASAISMPARLNPATAPTERSEPPAAATLTQARMVVGSTDPIQPVLVKTLTVRAATKTPSLVPLEDPFARPVAGRLERRRVSACPSAGTRCCGVGKGRSRCRAAANTSGCGKAGNRSAATGRRQAGTTGASSHSEVGARLPRSNRSTECRTVERDGGNET